LGLTHDVEFWNAFIAHADASVHAAKLLPELLKHLDQAPEFARRIKDLEHQGDKITHETLNTLHKTWITPLDREEIHALITRLDDVLDYIEATSERVTLFDIKEPTPEAGQLVDSVVASTEAVRKAVEALQDLKSPQKVLELCVEINRQENLADAVYRQGIARLFRERHDLLDVMKWRDIYDSLENATDRCEDVANIIEGIVLEHG
jgi:predicted phosphate transport protein (TIGR00153 family)